MRGAWASETGADCAGDAAGGADLPSWRCFFEAPPPPLLACPTPAPAPPTPPLAPDCQPPHPAPVTPLEAHPAPTPLSRPNDGLRFRPMVDPADSDSVADADGGGRAAGFVPRSSSAAAAAAAAAPPPSTPPSALPSALPPTLPPAQPSEPPITAGIPPPPLASDPTMRSNRLATSRGVPLSSERSEAPRTNCLAPLSASAAASNFTAAGARTSRGRHGAAGRPRRRPYDLTRFGGASSSLNTMPRRQGSKIALHQGKTRVQNF